MSERSRVQENKVAKRRRREERRKKERRRMKRRRRCRRWARRAGGTKGGTAICALCGHTTSEWQATLPLSKAGALRVRASSYARCWRI